MRSPICTSAAALLAGALLSAYTWTNGLVVWDYYGTPTGALTYNTATAEPTIAEFTRTLPPHLPAMPSDLLSKVRYMLPEGRDIRQNSQGLLPDSDDKTNLRFNEDAEVSVTFLSEGAGYRNSVGYFVYDPASPPRYPSEVREKILLADASMPAPLDAVSEARQNTINLGTLPAGKALGFMIVANGYSSSGRTLNGTRIPGVNDRPNSKWVFYTLRGLNPEASSAQNLNVHTVMLKDLSDSSDGYQRLVIGFEDINRETGGDHDFNDVVLAIHVTPRRSIANLNTVQTLASPTDLDTDGDGVKDALDEFPTDASRAFSRYYPTRDTWGTLAYEDLWPKRGDYDMNDLVVRYRTQEIMNAARQVTGVRIDYRLDARGADIESGFAVRLPGIAAGSVAQARLLTDGGKTQALGSERGQAAATFVVFQSSQQQLPGTGTGCPFGNTQAECPGVPTKVLRLELDFATPQASSAFSSPYDPFIFRTAKRGHEVHLPNQSPTALADLSLFGTQDDRSVLSAAKTYVDQNGRPWALNLPVEWKYPNETIDLTVPYPNMAIWAANAGASNADWYVSASVPKWLYIPR